jgi:hypothetical protein
MWSLQIPWFGLLIQRTQIIKVSWLKRKKKILRDGKRKKKDMIVIKKRKEKGQN